MSDFTQTPNLGLYKPSYDADEEEWGNHLNLNADKIDEVLGGVVNVLTHGADPTGVVDSAPAFRSCMGSNRRIVVPPGTYLFNSALSLPSPYVALGNPGVIAQSLSNFVIEGYGATIIHGTAITTGGQQANQMMTIMFDRCTNFAIKGLTIQGNVTGLTLPGQPNCAISVMSCTDFKVEDIHLTGKFWFAMNGDWLVNGLYRNIVMDAVVTGFDVAYLYRCVFDNCRLVGSDLLGTGPTHCGAGGFSLIVDPPNSTFNFTALPDSSFSSHNTWRNCSATNFSTGWQATTGTYFLLQGNRWFNNPGVSSALGIGVYVNYDATNGVAIPNANMTIIGDIFAGNGSVVPGHGLYIGGASSTYYTSDITVIGCQFDNNKSTGIGGAGANVRRVQSIGNAFTGANQTTGVGASILPMTGLTAVAYTVGDGNGPTWTTGGVAPTATAPVGSIYSRVGGAVGGTIYISRGGGTWAAVSGV